MSAKCEKSNYSARGGYVRQGGRRHTVLRLTNVFQVIWFKCTSAETDEKGREGKGRVSHVHQPIYFITVGSETKRSE